ncbi:hypothetical protein BSEG_04625, partial [Phocaeicola dorei 5_1_36/D4]
MFSSTKFEELKILQIFQFICHFKWQKLNPITLEDRLQS